MLLLVYLGWQDGGSRYKCASTDIEKRIVSILLFAICAVASKKWICDVEQLVLNLIDG